MTILNLQKAFDMVNQEILLAKMKNYGIGGVLYNWFSNYLSKDSLLLLVITVPK